MLFTSETWQFIGRFCKTDGGKMPDGSNTYKFVGFDKASRQDKEHIIRFDNSFYFNGGQHIISNIDDLKKSIEYKGMTYEEYCDRVKECLEKGIELYGIDW